MDGRKCLFLALSLLTGALGCAPLKQDQVVERIWLSSPDDAPSNKSSEEPKQHTPAMCVAAADFFMQEAAGKAGYPLVQQDLYQRARKAYQQATQLDAKFLPGYHGLANLYLTLDDYDHAIATYHKAIQLAPNAAQLSFDLGMCYCRKKDWPNGLQNLSRAVELDPENRRYVDVLGYTLARIGRYDESLTCFNRVQPKAQAHYHLALMLHHIQQTDLCKQHLQLALQADPQLQDARNLLAEVSGAVAAENQVPPQVQQTSYQDSLITGRQPAQAPLQQAPSPAAVVQQTPANGGVAQPPAPQQKATPPSSFEEPDAVIDLLPAPPLQIDPSVKNAAPAQTTLPQ
jgi:tetratricopeptide (TPR) repeat protein